MTHRRDRSGCLQSDPAHEHAPGIRPAPITRSSDPRLILSPQTTYQHVSQKSWDLTSTGHGGGVPCVWEVFHVCVTPVRVIVGPLPNITVLETIIGGFQHGSCENRLIVFNRFNCLHSFSIILVNCVSEITNFQRGEQCHSQFRPNPINTYIGSKK